MVSQTDLCGFNSALEAIDLTKLLLAIISGQGHEPECSPRAHQPRRRGSGTHVAREIDVSVQFEFLFYRRPLTSIQLRRPFHSAFTLRRLQRIPILGWFIPNPPNFEHDHAHEAQIHELNVWEAPEVSLRVAV